MIKVEKHLIKPSNKYFKLIRHFCWLSKNLYNHANFLVREEFIKNNKWLRYQELDKILKNDLEYTDYSNMPTSQSAQQILRLLDKNWTSFFKSIKDWKLCKNKYLGRPKLPKYKKKNGLYILILTNQNCKLKDNIIKFPKVFNNFIIKPQFINKSYEKFRQVRFIPDGVNIIAEIIYEVKDVDIKKDNKKYASIDIGVDNLATLTTNVNNRPIIINGKPLKSINQYYNKKLAYLKKVCKQMNNKYSSKKIKKLANKRNRKINDYMHKVSKIIVEESKKNDINTIVIGHNKEWKNKCKLSKKVNQNFIMIPFNNLIQKIQYKAKEECITVILTEESYTSGTSFLDNELPIKENYDKKRRIKRGLFKSNKNKLINADVNASFQILKKVVPNAYSYGIEDVVVHPVVVNVA